MEDYLEKAKDILHNISDYLIMGVIVLIIGFIIIWRLEIIFPENFASLDQSTDKIESTIPEITDDPTDKPIVEEEDEEVEDNPKEEDEDPPEEEVELVKISIPKGTPSSNIASILLDNELIESIDEFESKVDELKLEKALRSGEYEIKNDSSLETIVKIIANKD